MHNKNYICCAICTSIIRISFLSRIVNIKPNTGRPLGGVDVPLDSWCGSDMADGECIPYAFP